MSDDTGGDQRLRFKGATIEALAWCLLEVGSAERPLTSLDPEGLADDIAALLSHPDFGTLAPTMRRRVILQILLVYTGSWHVSGRRLIPHLQRVFAILCRETPLDIDALCHGYDLLYFLYWCWGGATGEQQGFADEVVKPFSSALQRPTDGDAVATSPAARRTGAPVKIALLAQFASRGAGNAIAEANRVILQTLAANPRRYSVSLFAWMQHDPATLAAYEGLGIEIVTIEAETPSERIAKLEEAFARVAPDVVITDMNAAIPTVLYERRIAPTQIYYQFGMPHWPLPSIDGVFHVWDFDLKRAGFDPATSVLMTIPYDLERFAGEVAPDLLAAERASLPPGRLVGNYGRLAKLTPAFIEAAFEGIRSIPDVRLVFGGSGDPAPARATIERLGAADRIVIVDRFVDGHVWGQILEVFLDTFPIPGGASCLEMIAKGKPVVCLAASDASNLAREQRIAMLMASDHGDYAAIVGRLLSDAAFAEKARRETKALVARYPTLASFALQLDKAIETVHHRAGLPALLRRLRARIAYAVKAWNRARWRKAAPRIKT